ncbi:MAG: hypothetical protein QOI37_1716 [Chloroflexota bacterium]|nr:hypothetical protein [Chloroflexota bacterium]
MRHHEPLRRQPTRPARARAVLIAVSFLVVALAGCTSGAVASGTPAGSVASVGPSMAPSVVPSVSPGVPGTSASPTTVKTTGDTSGDATPAYLDIAGLRVDAASAQLTLALDLGAAVPPGSPDVGQLAYVFSLDVDGDGTADYTATFELIPGGPYRPVLVDTRSGKRLEGAAYPGTASLAGQTVTLTLPLDSLGCPSAIGVRGASERTKGGVKSGDTVPDGATDWIQVTTGCPTPS